ncbi:hypothetical protein SNEBB_009044 [Seison nebaliae]|nr:hypothetical protein SNEBB_009044 [Seison nebaliae]
MTKSKENVEMEELMKVVVGTMKSSMRLPLYEKFDYMSLFEEFKQFQKEQSNTVSDSIDRLLHYNGYGVFQMRRVLSTAIGGMNNILEDYDEKLVDFNDGMIERISNLLDDADGKKEQSKKINSLNLFVRRKSIESEESPDVSMNRSTPLRSDGGRNDKSSFYSRHITSNWRQLYESMQDGGEKLERMEVDDDDQNDEISKRNTDHNAKKNGIILPFIPLVKRTDNDNLLTSLKWNENYEKLFNNYQMEENELVNLLKDETLYYSIQDNECKRTAENWMEDEEGELKKLLEIVQEYEPKPKSLHETQFKFVDTEDAFDEMLGNLRGHKCLAIDLEFFCKHSFQGVTALMQIGVTGMDYVIDTIELDGKIIQRLNEIMLNEKYLKVFHGADSDLHYLQRDFGIYIVNMIDTYNLSCLLQLRKHSLAYLLSYYCGVEKAEYIKLCDWSIRPLSNSMMEYARMDVHYLMYILARMTDDMNFMTIDQFSIEHDEDKERVNILIDETIKFEIKIDNNLLFNNQFFSLLEARRVTYTQLAFIITAIQATTHYHKRHSVNYLDLSLASSMREVVRICHEKRANAIRKEALHLAQNTQMDAQQFAAYLLLSEWRDYNARIHDESPHSILKKYSLIQLCENIPKDETAVALRCSTSSFARYRSCQIFQKLMEVYIFPIPEPTTTKTEENLVEHAARLNWNEWDEEYSYHIHLNSDKDHEFNSGYYREELKDTLAKMDIKKTKFLFDDMYMLPLAMKSNYFWRKSIDSYEKRTIIQRQDLFLFIENAHHSELSLIKNSNSNNFYECINTKYDPLNLLYILHDLLHFNEHENEMEKEKFTCLIPSFDNSIFPRQKKKNAKVEFIKSLMIDPFIRFIPTHYLNEEQRTQRLDHALFNDNDDGDQTWYLKKPSQKLNKRTKLKNTKLHNIVTTTMMGFEKPKYNQLPNEPETIDNSEPTNVLLSDVSNDIDIKMSDVEKKEMLEKSWERAEENKSKFNMNQNNYAKPKTKKPHQIMSLTGDEIIDYNIWRRLSFPYDDFSPTSSYSQSLLDLNCHTIQFIEKKYVDKNEPFQYLLINLTSWLNRRLAKYDIVVTTRQFSNDLHDGEIFQYLAYDLFHENDSYFTDDQFLSNRKYMKNDVIEFKLYMNKWSQKENLRRTLKIFQEEIKNRYNQTLTATLIPFSRIKIPWNCDSIFNKNLLSILRLLIYLLQIFDTQSMEKRRLPDKVMIRVLEVKKDDETGIFRTDYRNEKILPNEFFENLLILSTKEKRKALASDFRSRSFQNFNLTEGSRSRLIILQKTNGIIRTINQSIDFITDVSDGKILLKIFCIFNNCFVNVASVTRKQRPQDNLNQFLISFTLKLMRNRGMNISNLDASNIAKGDVQSCLNCLEILTQTYEKKQSQLEFN